MRAKLDSSGLDTGRHKAEREFNENPPEFEPAQGSGDGWNMDFDSFGSDSNSGGNNALDPFAGLGSMGGSTQDNAFSGSGGSFGDILNGQNQFNQQAQQQQQQPKKMEDMAFDVMAGAAKVGLKGLKGFVEEFKEVLDDPQQDWFIMLMYSMSKYSIAVFVIGAMLFALSLALRGLSRDYSLSLVITGMVTFAIGISVYMMKRDSYKKADEDGSEDYAQQEENSFSQDDQEPVFEESPDENAFANWGDEEDDSSFDESEDSGFDFSNWGEDDDSSEDYSSSTPEVKDVNSLLEEMDKGYIPAERYTREYLIETFTKALPLMSPDFSKMTVIPEDSDDFNDYDTYIWDICNRIGLPEEKIPKLLTLQENLFIVQLKLDRPKGFNKEQVVADELAMAYKVDQDTGRPRDGAENVYATYTTSGQFYFINLYVCTDPPKISLGDIYRKDREKLVKYEMPYVWGVTELGKCVWCDASNIDTMIISGIPRSGKSWKMQSTLLQLCMFNSPEDVNFYLLDPKGETSDYYHIRNVCPHFRCFRSTKESILRELERITTVEKDKRTKLFADKGVINIKDMKRRFPSEKVPYLYIIMDEMFTLVNSMTKDELNHLWELVGYVVTKMPNLGFRMICVPHRITNDYIKKSISNNIPNKVCIRATKSDIEIGLDIKSKDFQYSLPNKGDMAVKSTEVNGGEPLYAHGEAITDSNEGNRDIFRYVGEVWKRLLPNYEWANTDIEGGGSKSRESRVDVNHDFAPQPKEEYKVTDLIDEYADEEIVDEEDVLSVDNIGDSDDDNSDWNLQESDEGDLDDPDSFWK